MQQRGLFITLEGGEGAGKTTLHHRLARHFQQQGRVVVSSREPGGTPVAEALRGLILGHHDEAIDGMTELLVMFAARRQHLEQVIRPALAQGKVVICDRFVDSTYAYQGSGRGYPTEQIALLEQLVVGDTQPDLTLLLDIDPELGMSRARARGALDRMESEAMAFFQRVRAGFLALAEQRADNHAVIDASKTPEQVWRQVVSALPLDYRTTCATEVTL